MLFSLRLVLACLGVVVCASLSSAPVPVTIVKDDTAADGTVHDLTGELTWSCRKGRETITLGQGGEVTVTTPPPDDSTLSARGKNLAGRTMVVPVRITLAAP